MRRGEWGDGVLPPSYTTLRLCLSLTRFLFVLGENLNFHSVVADGMLTTMIVRLSFEAHNVCLRLRREV